MRLEEKLFSATALKHGQSGGRSSDKPGHAGASHFESAVASAGRKPQQAGAQPTRDSVSEPSTKLHDQAAAGDQLAATVDDDDTDPHAVLKHHVGGDGETRDDVKTRAERPAVERREDRGSSRDQRQPSQRDSGARQVSATDAAAKSTETRAAEPRSTFQNAAAVQSASARGAPLQTLSGQLAGQTLALLTQEPAVRGVESVAAAGRTAHESVTQEHVAQESSTIETQAHSHPEPDARSRVDESPARPAKISPASSVLSLATVAASSEARTERGAAIPASVTAKPWQAAASAVRASADRAAPSRTVTAGPALSPSGGTGAVQKDVALTAQGALAKADPAIRVSGSINAGVGARPTHGISGGMAAANTAPSAHGVDAAIVRPDTTAADMPVALPKAGQGRPSTAIGPASTATVSANAKVLPPGSTATQAAIRPIPDVADTTVPIRAVAADQKTAGKPVTANDAKIPVGMPATPPSGSRDLKTGAATLRDATAANPATTGAAATGATKAVPADSKPAAQTARTVDARATMETKAAGTWTSAQHGASRTPQGADTPATAARTAGAVRPAEARTAVEMRTGVPGTIAGQAAIRMASVLPAQLQGANDRAVTGHARPVDIRQASGKSAEAATVGIARPATEAKGSVPVQTPQKGAGDARIVDTKIGPTGIGEVRPAEARRTEPRIATTPVRSPEAKAPEAKVIVTERMAAQAAPRVAQPVGHATPLAETQLAAKTTAGIEIKPVSVPTPATDAKVVKNTASAPAALRAAAQSPIQAATATATTHATETPVATQKTAVDAGPGRRATLPQADRPDSAATTRVDRPATGHQAETARPSLTRSVVANGQGAATVSAISHHAVPVHPVPDPGSNGAHPAAVQDATRSMPTSLNRQATADPRDSSGAHAGPAFSALPQRETAGTADVHVARPGTDAAGSNATGTKTTDTVAAAVKADVPVLQPGMTMPVADAASAGGMVAGHADNALPVTAKPAQDAGAERHPAGAGTRAHPVGKVLASTVEKDPQDQPAADAEPAREPLPNGTAADGAAAEALVDRLMLARSLNVASAPQPATADSANAMFSLINAASFRPVTATASGQARPLPSEPVEARSDMRSASRERLTATRDEPTASATQPTLSLPSSALPDRATENAAALPGTDQVFRFARADGKGQALSVSLSADGDQATIAPDTGGFGNRAETVTVLDSRRFLGVTSASNAQAVTSLIPSDPQWADAMRLGALGADPYAATGKVVNTLKIQMHPIELGLVTATLRLKDDELHVDLKVETGDAYRQLSDDQGAMVKALRAQGFAVDQINIVYTSSDSTASSGNGASQSQMGQGASQGGRERPADGSLQGGERNGSSNGDQQGSGDRRTRREAFDDGPLVNGRTRSGDVYM